MKMSEKAEEGKKRYGANSKVDPKVENPGHVDESIWERAKKKAQEEYGAGHWAAVSFLYKRLGGRFHHKP